MPSPDIEQHIELAPELRLVLRRRTDDTLDLRLARRSPLSHHHDPRSWKLTQAGFRLPLAHVAEFRAILRDLVGP